MSLSTAKVYQVVVELLFFPKEKGPRKKQKERNCYRGSPLDFRDSRESILPARWRCYRIGCFH